MFSRSVHNIARLISRRTTKCMMSTDIVDGKVYYMEESVFDYEPGGFHPLRLGDALNKGRYKVVRKLGWGIDGTVWLAHDAARSRHVAIKINRAKLTRLQTELHMMLGATRADQTHPGCQHVVQLLDHFRLVGPNGTHVCLVMEPLCSSIQDVLSTTGSIPPDAQKPLIRQMLLGLDFLHRSCGIIHTDLKAANFFFDVPDVEDIIAADLANHPTPEKMEKYFPLTCSLPLSIALKPTDVSIKLGDLGSGHFERLISKHFTRGNTIQPSQIRAPEVLLGAPWDTSSDIWSLGCTIFEITMNGRDFMTITDPEEDDLAAAEFLQGVFGPFPRHIIEQGCDTGRFFKPDGSFRLDINPNPRFDIVREQMMIKGETAEEVENYISFLKAMIAMDPMERATTAMLLEHPWLSSH